MSFISPTLILPPAFELLSPSGVIIPLIKPQFVVREPALCTCAIEKVQDFIATSPGVSWRGVIESPIPGSEGNKEFLACLCAASA